MGVGGDNASLGGRDLLGLGGLLAGCVVGCTALGLFVDHLADSAPVGVLVGVAAGIVLGSTAFVVRVRRALRYDASDDPGHDAGQ